jgi:putative thioredoxin
MRGSFATVSRAQSGAIRKSVAVIYVSVRMDATEQSFSADVVERSAEVPVVVDFWADWCGPCRMLTPVLEREIAERDGQVELVKVDVDANPALANEYDVRGIPAVKAFRNGRVVSEFVGVQSPQSVAAFLDALTQPTEGEQLLASLRSSGAEPEVLAALDGGDPAAALELILGEIPDAEPERREELRRLALALFDALGPEDPVTQTYRRRLASLLF